MENNQRDEHIAMLNKMKEPNQSADFPVQGVTKDVKKGPLRWVMLSMACCFLLGSYYCYDIPGAIETRFKKDYDLTSFQYAFLYTIYSYPNCLLPLFGGVLLDKIGIRFGLILFTVVLTLG
mgnify:CR=1 FL=1